MQRAIMKLPWKRNEEKFTVEKAKHAILSNWHYIALIIIILFAFHIRYLPARHGELQALDPFYIYRMTDYILNNNMQFPEIDTLRYYPDGLPTAKYEYPGPFYIPAIIYSIFFKPFGVSLFSFAFIYSPLMGAIGILIMYFLAKEIFDDRIIALLSSFFLATVPGFITRTSAGFFEKEPGATPFMMIGLYLFVRAYKRNSWRDGILGGLAFGIMAITWGGIEYIKFFIAFFVLVMLLINRYSENLVKSYVPFAVFALLIPYITPRSFDLLHSTGLVPIAVLGLLILKWLTVRYKLLKKDQEPFLIPAALGISVLGALIGATQSPFIWDRLMSIIRVATLSKGVMGSTVAENAPGSWNDIMNMFGTRFFAAWFPQQAQFIHNYIVPYTSAYFFMFLGTVLMVYTMYRKKDVFYLFPIIWLPTTIWGMLGYVRIMFLVGPPVAISTAFFWGFVLKYAYKIKITRRVKNIDLKIPFIIISAILAFVIAVNASSAYVFGNSIGPSYNKFFDEAMQFLREKTPENSSVLSWWDFGYWFQTKGKRPSIADGGNVKGQLNDRIAEWFVDDPANWDNYTWFFERYRPNYILMDYTLPPKYGAISKIASKGKQIVGILQFGNKGAMKKGNKTIYQFSSPPYELWVPFNSAGGVDGRPVFFVSQGGQFVQRAYINDLCTTNGIIKLGNATPDTLPGCVALTPFGVFYIPPEAENTIFTRLMFMDGYGLKGLEKVFENGAIRIYKVDLEALIGNAS